MMYGSSFCIVTRSPRAFSNEPRLDAVRPLPDEEATPPVTKTCLVGKLLPETVRSTEVHANTEMRMPARSRMRRADGAGFCLRDLGLACRQQTAGVCLA